MFGSYDAGVVKIVLLRSLLKKSGFCSAKSPTSAVGGLGVLEAVLQEPSAARRDWYSVNAAEVAPQQPPGASQLTALPLTEGTPGPVSSPFLSTGVTIS